jgi:hypothetical protein
MNSKNCRAGGTIVGLMLCVSASAASAQWHATGLGVGEYDTKQTILLLAGLGASQSGLGIRPGLGVQGYYLGYDNGPGRTNVFTIKPYVGLENNYDGGQIGGNVGYSFANKDVSGVVSSVAVSQSNGVVLSGNWDQWGKNNDPMGYQVLASYNFGGKDIWTRGRVTRNLTVGQPSQRRLGAEVAYLSGTGYNAWQPGAVLELHDPKGNILGLGAGMKFFGNGGGNAFYVKAETVLPLGGR